jgi:putative ABC transport system permease protein
VSHLVALAGRRFFRRHPWQLVLAIAGVALGVAVVTGVDLAGRAAQRAFDVSRQVVTGAATHQIVSRSGDFDEALFRTLAVDRGLDRVAPITEGRVVLDDGRALTLSGFDPFSEAPFRRHGTAPGAQGRAGALLTEPGAIVVTPELAAELGVSPGGTVAVNAAGARRQLKLVGLFHPGRAESPLLRDYVFADIATAQEVLGLSGRLTRIDLMVEEPAAQALRRDLPTGTELISTGSRSENMLEMTEAFRINLRALSLLALLVGAFLIHSTMSFLVVQRRRVIGTLRTLGVSRRQLFTSVIQESFLVGLPGTGAGLVLGWVLGSGLTSLVVRTIDDLYFRLEVAGIPLDWGLVLKGAVLGIGVTVASSLGPAREAAAVSPRSALSRASLERRVRRRLPLLVVLAIVASLAAVPLLRLDDHSLVAAFAGMFAVIVAAALITPPVIAALMAGLTGAFGRYLDLPSRMALRGVDSSLSRTGVAVAALMVSVASVIGVGLMVGSFRSSVDHWLGDSLRSDVYVSLGESWYAEGGDGDRLAVTLADLPEVATLTRSTRARIATPDDEIRLWALDPADADWGLVLISGDPVSARRSFDAGRSVLLSESFARRSGLSVGDTMTLPTARGTSEFGVAGVFRDYTSDRGVVAVHMDRYREDWGTRRVDGFGLTASPGVEARDLRLAVDMAMGGVRGVRVATNREIRSASLAVFDRTFTVTRVLQVLVGVVAFLGVLSALQSLQMERVRELAILRAVGWTPGQVRRLVLGQTAVLGLTAGTLAIPLGVVLASILIQVINVRAFAWTMELDLDASVMAEGLTLAAVAAVVGGVYPAWRSARRRPAVDLRDE